MNSEEEFINKLNKLVESKEFPFEEKEWEKARQLIDANKGRNRIFPFVIGGLLLLIGGAAGTYVIQSKQLSHTNQINNEQPLSPEKKSVSQHSGAQHVTKTEVTAPQPDPEPAKPAAANPGEVQKGSNTKSKIPEQPVTKTFKEPVTQSNEGPAPSKINTPPVAAVIKPASAVQPTAETIKGGINEEQTVSSTGMAAVGLKKLKNEKNSAKDPSETSPVSTAVVKNNNTPVNEENTSVTNEGVVNLSIKKVTKTATPESGEGTISSAQPVTVNNVETPAPKNVTAEDKKTPASEPVASVLSSDPSLVKADPVIEEIKNEKRPDSVATVKPDTAAAIPDLLKASPNSMMLSFEAGGTYLGGWKTSEGKIDARGVNPVIGLNYYYPLADRLTLSIGAQYTSVGNLRSYSHTSKTTKYSTGEESKVTVITPERLHYILAPLKINFELTPSDVIGGGCNFAYLLDVASNMETYDVKLNKTENARNKKVHGYTEGFKNFETQFSVFYRRHLYGGLYLNGEVFLGATDIKDNDFFNSPLKEKNYGLKLTLVYRILNRQGIK